MYKHVVQPERIDEMPVVLALLLDVGEGSCIRSYRANLVEVDQDRQHCAMLLGDHDGATGRTKTVGENGAQTAPRAP